MSENQVNLTIGEANVHNGQGNISMGTLGNFLEGLLITRN